MCGLASFNGVLFGQLGHFIQNVFRDSGNGVQEPSRLALRKGMQFMHEDAKKKRKHTHTHTPASSWLPPGPTSSLLAICHHSRRLTHVEFDELHDKRAAPHTSQRPCP